ncbi:MAG: hypothetical protein KDA60_14485 [Planctomycetales bacterium]|nr:hypothetical protein [Planctomycetales bacterium]
MVVDRTHLSWCLITSTLFVAATIAYLAYAHSVPGGPHGGSWQGLAFGVAGTLLMVFAGLLSGRKKLPGIPLGSARWWLKAHVWMGLLSYPLILYHAAFRWGGTVESTLMVLFTIVTLSGIVGLFLQNQLPRIIKSSVPAEAIYEQLPRVCLALCRNADDTVAQFYRLAVQSRQGQPAPARPTAEPGAVLVEFYQQKLRPFLQPHVVARSELNNPSRAAALFARTRAAVPVASESELGLSAHATLDQLERIYTERRQLATQMRLHHWLHGWLFLHVPLSLAMLVLALAHITMSLWY